MATIIQISDSIKGEIAEKVCEQAGPGYVKDYRGEWFVVDGERLMHKERNAPWSPWSDDASVISVDDLVFIYGGAEAENCDFDPSPAGDIEGDTTEAAWGRAVEFALGYVPNEYNADEYETRYE